MGAIAIVLVGVAGLRPAAASAHVVAAADTTSASVQPMTVSGAFNTSQLVNGELTGPNAGTYGYTPFTCPTGAPAGCGAQVPGLGAYTVEFSVPSGGADLQAGDKLLFRAPAGVQFPTSDSSTSTSNGVTSTTWNYQLYWDCLNFVGVEVLCNDEGSWSSGGFSVGKNDVTVTLPSGTDSGFSFQAGSGDFSLQAGGRSAVLVVSDVRNPPAGVYAGYDWTLEGEDSSGAELDAPGQAPSSDVVTFANASADPSNSTLTASSTTATVGPNNGVALTATIRDQYGNPVPNDQVNINTETGSATLSNSGGGSGSTPETGSDGTVMDQFVDTVAENASFQAYDARAGFELSMTPTVTFNHGAPTAADSQTVVKSCDAAGSCQQESDSGGTIDVPAGGSAQVTVKLADQYGNPTVTTGSCQNGICDGDEVVLEPEQAGTFLSGSITPSDQSDCSATVTPLAGAGCTNDLASLALSQQQTISAGQATFTITDPTAETVGFSVDDVTSGVASLLPFTLDFEAGPADAGKSTLTPASQQVVANGNASGTITVTLRDANGNPVSGTNVQVSELDGSLNGITAVQVPDTTSRCTTQAAAGVSDCNGQAEFQVTGTSLGEVQFEASYRAGTSGSWVPIAGKSGTPDTADVDFVAGPTSASNSTVTASTSSLLAGAAHHATVTVMLNDASGHAVSNHVVSLAGSAGTSSTITPLALPAASGCPAVAAGTTNCAGEAEFQVSDPNPEAVTYTATDTTTGVILSEQAVVAFTLPPSPNASAISASAPSVEVGRPDTITLTLADGNGNPLAGKEVCLTQTTGTQPSGQCATGSSPSTVTPQQATTDSHGQAQFTVTATAGGTVTYGVIDISDYGASAAPLGPTTSVTFTAPPSEANNSTVTAVPDSTGVNTASTVTVTLKDVNGDPITGHQVSLGCADAGAPTTTEVPCPGSVTLTPSGASTGTTGKATATTDANGQATFTVSDSAAETDTLAATDMTASPAVMVARTASVTFVLGEASLATLTASESSALADGGTTAAGLAYLTVTLDPADPSEFAGDQVSVNQGNGDVSTVTPVAIPDSSSGCAQQAPAGTADCNGQARFQVSDVSPQAVTYTATDVTTGVAIGATSTVTFVPMAPVISDLTPNRGPVAGGTQVTITGTGLTVAGTAPTVSFGTAAAAKVSCSSASSCTVIAPAAAAQGKVTVVVTTSGGASTAAAAGDNVYQYVGPQPRIAAIAPARGPAQGGTLVKVTGVNLGTESTTTVRFGNARVRPVSVNKAGTVLMVRTPAELPGRVAVTVTTANGTSAKTGHTHFTYVAKHRHKHKHRRKHHGRPSPVDRSARTDSPTPEVR